MTSAAPAKPALLADAEFNHKWDDLSNYTVLRKSKDPRFGDIIVLKHKIKKELIFAKEKWVNSKDKASADIVDMKNRAALNDASLQRFLGYSSAIDKQLCSTNYLVIGYYEFPKSDLYKELQDKVQNGQDFSAEDLRQISNDSLTGIAHLHDQRKIHGDIRPLHIGYDRDEKKSSLLDRLNDPSPEDRAQLNNLQSNKELFVSPELWAKIKGKKGFEYSKDKNDYYALGLTLLNLGLGRSIQDVYQPDGGLNREKLNQYIGEFDAKYKSKDPALSGQLRSLLAEDEKSRGVEAIRLAGVKADEPLVSAPGQIRVQSSLPSEVVTTTINHPAYQSYGQTWVSSTPETVQAEGKTVTVLRPDGTTYTYIQRTNTSNNVIYNYDQSKLVYVQPFQPVANQQYISAPISAPISDSYVNSRPSLVVVNAPITSQVISSSAYTPAVVSTSVEVRRGSSIPYIGDQKAILKQYIMKDDRLVEIEVKEGDKQPLIKVEESKGEEESKAEEKKEEEESKEEEKSEAHPEDKPAELKEEAI